MSLKESGIEYKKLNETLIATIRGCIKERQELHEFVNKLVQDVPKEYIVGPAFCIYHFTTNVIDGFDAEVGFPVIQAVESGEIKSRSLPEIEVLSLIQKGPIEKRREILGTLFGYTTEHAIISHEFYREIYLDENNPQGNAIEFQFVIHNWNQYLAENIKRVLGEEVKEEVMRGNEDLTLETSAKERVQWVKGALERLDNFADTNQYYDILSSCAHRFPKELIKQLKIVYEKAKAQKKDSMQAIDAVREYMAENRPWAMKPPRKGNIIYITKRPSNPQGYENAKTELEKKKAYCFCPIVCSSFDTETVLPDTFCNCSAGWFRQQWEEILGKPVQIEIVKSILKEDDVCEFAIHIPKDL